MLETAFVISNKMYYVTFFLIISSYVYSPENVYLLFFCFRDVSD